jgi:hypothetical protein
VYDTSVIGWYKHNYVMDNDLLLMTAHVGCNEKYLEYVIKLYDQIKSIIRLQCCRDNGLV